MCNKSWVILESTRDLLKMTLCKSIRGMGRENGCVQAMHECMFVRFRPYSLVIVHTWLLVHTTYLLRPHWPWTASLPYYRVIRGWVLFFGILDNTNKKSRNETLFCNGVLNLIYCGIHTWCKLTPAIDWLLYIWTFLWLWRLAIPHCLVGARTLND